MPVPYEGQAPIYNLDRLSLNGAKARNLCVRKFEQSGDLP